MSIGVTGQLVPLGSFPVAADDHLNGGFRSVADTTARDAIDETFRKDGMRVWTQDDSKLWRLGPGLTNGDWIEVPSGGGGTGDVTINATLDTSINNPATIHTYTVVATGRAVIAYDVTVTTIKTFGGSANFRIAATFEVDNGGTITEKNVTFMNGPFRDDPAWDVVFNILPSGIELQVVGINALQRWHAVGYISFVDRLFPEA